MKKKLTLVVTCIVLVAAMVIGGTLAYFTDTDDATNTFTVGNVKIVLDESQATKGNDNKWTSDKDVRVDKNTYENIYPGAVLPKDPTIHNTGKNDAYVRLVVTMSINAFKLFGDEDPIVTITKMINADEENWTYVGQNKAGTYYDLEKGYMLAYEFRYNKVLKGGEDTTPLFTEVTIPTTLTEDMVTKYTNGSFVMELTAQAIQADSFVATDNGDGTMTSAMDNAWAAFDAQNK